MRVRDPANATVFFLRENTNFRPWNDRINATLEFLGSSKAVVAEER